MRCLLPISGRNGAIATTIRDGFMTAYYQTPEAQRTPINIYDTGETGIAENVARATQEGADIIVGPLTRDEVVAAAGIVTRRPPILALNFLPTGQPAPTGFFQYALSPEDEARLAAHRILADGHKNGLAIVPSGDWGTRVLAAFKQELEAGGGGLYATTALDTAMTDYSDSLTTVLRISDSSARHRRLESILGTKLQFEPRRRGDIEFIFAPAQANIERLLRPQLRFHFAGSIPTYATSDAFEPDPHNNQDLEGLMFPDMPWMLGSDLADAVRNALQTAYPNGGGPRRNRYFAFGFDAYRLATGLHSGGNQHPGRRPHRPPDTRPRPPDSPRARIGPRSTTARSRCYPPRERVSHGTRQSAIGAMTRLTWIVSRSAERRKTLAVAFLNRSARDHRANFRRRLGELDIVGARRRYAHHRRSPQALEQPIWRRRRQC